MTRPRPADCYCEIKDDLCAHCEEAGFTRSPMIEQLHEEIDRLRKVAIDAFEGLHSETDMAPDAYAALSAVYHQHLTATQKAKAFEGLADVVTYVMDSSLLGRDLPAGWEVTDVEVGEGGRVTGRLSVPLEMTPL